MFRRLTILPLLLLAASLSFAETKPSSEEITGVVLAYDEIQATWVPCYDTCHGSLIIRMDGSYSTPRLIRVNIEYRNHKFPTQLIETNAHWRFQLVRTPNSDEPLDRFLIQNATADAPEKRWPVWRVVSSGEKLPFDQSIPSYSLNSFKEVRWP